MDGTGRHAWGMMGWCMLWCDAVYANVVKYSKIILKLFLGRKTFIINFVQYIYISRKPTVVVMWLQDASFSFLPLHVTPLLTSIRNIYPPMDKMSRNGLRCEENRWAQSVQHHGCRHRFPGTTSWRPTPCALCPFQADIEAWCVVTTGHGRHMKPWPAENCWPRMMMKIMLVYWWRHFAVYNRDENSFPGSNHRFRLAM